MDRHMLVRCLIVELLFTGLFGFTRFSVSAQDLAAAKPYSLPAIFVFGDSLVDAGNNNYLNSLSKANFLHNGMDFPSGPTGRFCNGRTVVDIMCDIVGLPYVPPYLALPQTNDSNILRGVNFASGAGGILDDSGANFIARLSMDQQITYSRNTVHQLKEQLGEAGAAELVRRSLVWVVIGNNDFIDNYLLSTTNTSELYTPASFNSILIDKFSQQLSALYDLGFRKFFVAGVGPLGCIPHQLALAQTPDCVQATNDEVQDFDYRLRMLLDQLMNGTLPGSMFVYGNIYGSLATLIADPAAHGFRVVNQGCCGSGLYRGQYPCQPLAAVCPNRTEYLFWDPYHPTEAANLILANGLYNGGPDVISPINIQQLIDLP